MDPAELRQKNFVRSFPYQTPVIMTYDAGDYSASLNKAMETRRLQGLRQAQARSAKSGKLRGIGFSTYIEACGIAPSAAVGSLGAGVGLWESAEVRVNPTGSVEVLTGSHSHGQGHETTFAQLVSERLGIPIEKSTSCTATPTRCSSAWAPTARAPARSACRRSCKALDKVEAKAKKIAAHLLEAAEGDIEFKDGKFTVAGTDKAIAFAEVALQAYIAHKFPASELEPGLRRARSTTPPTSPSRPAVTSASLRSIPRPVQPRSPQWTAVDDFGTIINPMIVEGQVHGGIAQGVGQALLERAVYDKDGQLMTGSYMDYAMPRAENFPTFQVDMTETVCPSNPLGIKGCGEAGAIAAPAAVINAITDAHRHTNRSTCLPRRGVWRAVAEIRRLHAPLNIEGRSIMYAFKYQRPTSVRRGGRAARRQRGCQAAGRRPYADPDDEAAARARRR